MITSNLTGTGVAIITPFRNDGSIDFNALHNLVDYIITNKVDYLVVLGTTGESVTLSTDEKNAVISNVIESVANRVPIIVGIGGNNTNEIVQKIRNTDFTGISALMSVAPYYNKPNQRGLYLHYKAIAENSPVPVIMYNVPGRTASNISAETTIKLANDFKNIIGIKEASGNFYQVMEIIKNRPQNFLVISGDDATALPFIALGANGLISVLGNALPMQVSELVRKSLEHNFTEAQKIQYSILDVMNAMFEDGNPAGIKAALQIKGLIKANLRLPMVPVEEKLYQKIELLIKKLN